MLADLVVQLNIKLFVTQDETGVGRLTKSAKQELKAILTIEDTMSESPLIHSFNQLLLSVEEATCRLSLPHSEDEALIVFSSGTTGIPKPVCYTHSQLSLAVNSILEAFADIEEGSILVCWLPLANLFQRMINFAAVARNASSYIVEDPRSVMNHIGTANPHVFIGVPRFFEKVYASVMNRIETQAGASASIAKWAIAIGKRRAQALREDTRCSVMLRLSWRIADRLALRKIRAAFGTHLRYFISGSSPMPYWLLEWFDGLGLPVLEAYGISENIVPIAINRYNDRKLGTVGKPLAAHEVKLAEDGEIVVIGAGVARNHAKTTATAHAAKENAQFLATGDLGSFDIDGFLRITGRKSDIFKTSTGKWISPAEIETRLRQLAHVDYAVVLGTNRKAIVALLGITSEYFDTLVVHVQSGNGALSQQLAHQTADVLADLPTYQQPAGLLIIDAGSFSIGGGELTTNLKVRRKHIEEKFAADVDRLYDSIDQAAATNSTKFPYVMIHRTEST